jgi:hypothetical protein
MNLNFEELEKNIIANIKNNNLNLEILNKVKINCYNLLTNNFKVKRDNSNILIIFDDKTLLSKVLTYGYLESCSNIKKEIGNFQFNTLNFYKFDHEEIKKEISKLKEKDLVILIQSSSFRMSKYRWRNELYKLGLKVIEHPHLEKNSIFQIETYINSIESNLDYYLNIRDFLKKELKKANSLQLISTDNSILEFKKLDEIYDNIAYFEDKKHYGTRFPVGEIISESLNLEKLNGEFLLYAFPDKRNILHFSKPFKCYVKNGYLVRHEGPEKFNEIIEMIKTEHPEKKVMIRELGLGLNKHITREKYLNDVSSFERIEGVHLSLGMKHQIYAKKLYPIYGRKFYQRYHLDVFLDIKEIFVNNNRKIFDIKKGWLIENN